MEYNEKFENEFNEFLVDTFHNILKVELQFIKQIPDTDLSMREIHLIEIAGKTHGPTTISEIAKKFQITLASVTVMVNKLVVSGYLIKKKSEEDARNTFVELTAKGKEIDKKHFEFHTNMVKKVSSHLSDFERQVLYSGVQGLNRLFTQELVEEEVDTRLH